MRKIALIGRWSIVVSLLLAGVTIPRFIFAEEHYENPFSAKAATLPSWDLKNPDAKYAIASDICPGLSLSQLATQAMSSDEGQSKSAIEQLRAEGPAGLDAMLSVYRAQVEKHRDGKAGKDDATWPKLRAAIDAVAMQRDAYASGLYWYTDMAAAEKAARAAGKPILSLRLLGKLSDEYSCANSRFFRTVLYANREVSKELREKFVLHWQSVRPVPVITIDFGDGRKIRRTITGNSIHYVLSADGKVVDGIPGLYGPKSFLLALAKAEAAAVAATGSTIDEPMLEKWHAEQQSQIQEEFWADARRVGLQNISTLTALTEQDWAKVARLHIQDAKLDNSSVELAAAKYPDAAEAAPRGWSKRAVESPLIQAMRNFQRSIALDTVRNEYLFHWQIHKWLADPSQQAMATGLDALNGRVYAELFLTPDSDPWLGLVSADTYSALENDGVCERGN